MRFLTALALLALLPISPASALTPDKPIDLLKLDPDSEITTHLNPKVSQETDPDKAFHILDNGNLLIPGDGWGYVRTNDEFENYHLVAEYKWGEHTWGKRAGKARDSGILIHAQGEDGALGDSWIHSVEVQLIEGGSGNLAVVASKDNPTHTLTKTHKLPSEEHGRKAPASYVDPNWTNTQGYRGENDVEQPVGDWNRIEVIARNNTLTVLLNGQKVNEATELNPSSGHIGLQSEGAELQFRRLELHPVDSFSESWQPDQASTETGTGLLPRALPLSPEESMATIKVDGPWKLELVAAEPLVTDPVDVAFDEQGRLYVAEMRDYQGIPEHGPLLSRIRLLTDTNGDGKIDSSTIWADELDHCQGLCRLNGGFLVTTRDAVLFLKDTDGDDIADHREVLYRSNDPKHTQVAVSSPRWGPDNAIYLNNGMDGKEIYPGDQRDDVLMFERQNLRYDPFTDDPKKRLTPISGRGQFGAAFDDWGRHFFCSNRNPAMMAVMPLEAMNRNPYYPISQGHEDVAPFGGDAKVYPLTLTHTTAGYHAGTATAACGLGVYRGDLMPDLKGNLFVCEPPGQLVIRYELEPNGASFKANRIGDGKDFIASSDEWFRPVNLRNAPDGAFYLCDMQRRFIDHARFFPETFSEDNYMRGGFDHGRIYRLVPKNKMIVPKSTDRPLPDSVEELAKLVIFDNAWQRIHARRRLMEERHQIDDPLTLETLKQIRIGRPEWQRIELKHGENDFVGILEDGDPRMAFLALCHAKTLDSPELIAAAAKALIKHPSDHWLKQAALSATENTSADLLLALLPNAVPDHADLIRDLAMITAHRGELDDIERVTAWYAAHPDTPDWNQFAALKGLNIGLRKTEGPLKDSNLSKLLNNPPPAIKPHAPALRETLTRARNAVLDPEQPIESRIAAIALLDAVPFDEAIAAFDQLLDKKQPASLQRAAFTLMRRLTRAKVAEYLFEKLPDLGPVAQAEAINFLTSSNTTVKPLLEKMKAGEIPPTLLDIEKRWRYGRPSAEPEVRALALELFGKPSADRAAVLKDYTDALASLEGDPAQGESIFATNCSACHKIDGQGVDVAPDISDVRIKPPEAILSDILDPNRVVETRWSAVAVETTNGLAVTGIVDAETPDALTLKMQGGLTQSIPRNEIKTLTPLNQSLMPVGLEAAITKEQMAHLIAYLKNR
ncbi:MAG: PVC-type heme-binding CxxCH protein [Verrucomicrobiota bacterium]